MELNDIRQSIDAIDDELVRLFTRRMECSREIALAKQQTGKPIRDISARLAPLPPRSSRMSALPSSKRYTYFLPMGKTSF